MKKKKNPLEDEISVEIDIDKISLPILNDGNGTG